MGYEKIPAVLQPTTTTCWSSTMSWWTYAVKEVPNCYEATVRAMFSEHTQSDGKLEFPEGFKIMLQDDLWGMTIGVLSRMGDKDFSSKFKKSPMICGYWDYSFDSHHAVALYGYNSKTDEIRAMDPMVGHVKRDLSYYMAGSFGHGDILIGYIK